MFKFKLKHLTVIPILLIVLLFNCEEKKEKIQLEKFKFPDTDLSVNGIIPKPLSVRASNSAFALDEFTVIKNLTNDITYNDVISKGLKNINTATGLNLKFNDKSTEGKTRYITINSFKSDTKLGIEDYKINIQEDSIKISTNTAEGGFRAMTTLLQLIPIKSNDTIADRKIWPIPTGVIEDAPNFGYRGTMLDVARHFFTVEEVKKYIDLLSYYKINRLHLHLSDDQGWRIEIKSWPKLTEIGSKSEVGGGEGGFYTQEDYIDIVDYATKHFIMVIPEIDMPGHTNAASLSYPFLNGNGKTLKPYTGMQVGFSTFDTRKDTVYTFIDDVIREISQMTPGPYFHIGGDESHVTKKDDYIYFVNKVEKIVHKYGKQMIGWDEVATADMDSTSIAQFWLSDINALEAAQKNMKIIMSPGKKAYLDMKYDKDSEYGLTWAGNIPVDTAYIWNPETYIKDFPKENILGIEAPLWSETISNLTELQYLAFPRIIGYSELGWSTTENRNWEDYKRRLILHQEFLERNDVNFYKSPKINWRE